MQPSGSERVHRGQDAAGLVPVGRAQGEDGTPLGQRPPSGRLHEGQTEEGQPQHE